MIEERALCAAMKAAWRGTGYEVYAAGDALVITTDEMGVEMSRKNASRKVLALLALQGISEMLKCVYGIGEAVSGTDDTKGGDAA